MTAEEFVKACHYEKIDALKDYFEADSESAVGKIIQKLIQSGVRRDDLYRLVDTVLNDTYYTILLGLDGRVYPSFLNRLGRLQTGQQVLVRLRKEVP